MHVTNSELLSRSWMTLGLVLAIAVVLTVLPDLAWAAEDDWVKPGTTLIDRLRGGLVTIGALVVGLAVVGVGIWAAATGRLEWPKLVYVILGGVLIMAGPSMVAALLEKVQSQS